MSSPSFTQALIQSHSEAYQAATQSAFLRNAARGKVPKATLGTWLANDRLYIHGYIRGTGRLLSFLGLPQTVAEQNHGSDAATQLFDWSVDALVNIRREEAFFVDTARRYGIDVNLPTGADGAVVPQAAKLPGLQRFETLFDKLAPGPGSLLPWLESAVVFYGTEKCYLDAWTWAKSQLSGTTHNDDDGGALRAEFIPNWTSADFVVFVDMLGKIIDDAVAEEVRRGDGKVWDVLMARVTPWWEELLAAEEGFWPAME
ncbi:hypothetical protein VHEMI09738 [[Torrubiella] hemipterigena]|uniref:Heme oxygenase-like protein n=1 Tax=[Torrubiella] hemipterigena TaxID=1531966 RepID=A0A0A1TQN6_9HYPO|nr:hypothetical protein VHEMI09738 [[Torrubiella] hemipterigena]